MNGKKKKAANTPARKEERRENLPRENKPKK